VIHEARARRTRRSVLGLELLERLVIQGVLEQVSELMILSTNPGQDRGQGCLGCLIAAAAVAAAAAAAAAAFAAAVAAVCAAAAAVAVAIADIFFIVLVMCLTD